MRKYSLVALVLALAGCTCLPCPECPVVTQCPATAECPEGTPCPTCPEMPTITPTPEVTPTATSTAAPTPQPQANLLVNGGFEGGYYQDTANWFVPDGWRTWESCPGQIHSELEAHQTHVRHGSFSARMWQSYNTCAMGLYQQVDALPGATYQFIAYGNSWSTSNPVVDTPSEAWVKAWIGIDPTGGTDPQGAVIVWSETGAPRDEFRELMVTAVAQHTRITVFLKSIPDWGMARSDTFWDDASLYEVALPDGTAAPAVSTPAPTATIIEVTPLGGDIAQSTGEKVEDIKGTYTPKGMQNVRACAFAGVGCDILYRLGAGVPVVVYGRVTIYPSGDVWLCLDMSVDANGVDIGSQCGKVAAYQIGTTVYGELTLKG